MIKKTYFSLLLTVLFLLIILESCTKLKGSFQVAIDNKTSFKLNELNVSCGAEPIQFEVPSNSISTNKTLNIGGREIVNPIMVSINLTKYSIDTSIKTYIIGNFEDRKKLKSDKLNYLTVTIDSSKLPDVNFQFELK